MRLESRRDLIADLQSKKFRDAFVSSRVSNTLALQIRAMRQEHGWSQAYLAELLGTSQNAIYRLESPQYGKPSITTLKRLASIFDVGLAVWFTSFSRLVDRVMDLSTEDIVVPSFSNDPGLQEKVADSGEPQTTVSRANSTFLLGSFQRSITSMPRVSTIDVGQIAVMVRSSSGGFLSQNMIPSQPVKSTDATHKGEIEDGGRAAA